MTLLPVVLTWKPALHGQPLGLYLEQHDLVFSEQFVEAGQFLGELDNELHCENGDFGNVSITDISWIFIVARKALQQLEKKVST